MYLPKHFAETRPEVLHAAIAAHPLATLITHSARGAEADLLPLLMSPDGRYLNGHVARANPLWRSHPADTDVLAVFTGAQAYISPNWYPSKQEHGKAVPTWNYITVQVRGRLQVMDDAEWARALVTSLTETHEATQAQPWQVGDAPPDYIDSMLKAIVGIRIEISELVGKWKVSQNQSTANRAGVINGLRGKADDMAEAVAQTLKSP